MTLIDKAEALALIVAYAEKIFDAPIYHYHSETTGKPEPIDFAEFGLSVDIHDAKALGVHTTHSDRWHGISDIRRDEVRDTEIAVMRKALAPLLDAIAALPARGVGVRPLVWVPDGTDSFFGNGLFNYHAKHCMDGHWKWSRFNSGTWYLSSGLLDGDLYTEETAKAAAQADYEARILAALAPTDAAQAREAALEWVKKHGIHAEDCDTVTRQDDFDLDFNMETICTCGLTAILALIGEGRE